ncbi:O-acetylhomoserine aminocarboxypropyltransferase/cysteine synthase [Anaerotruncus massiliensis (ex Liu et al. 2021)]|uniref:O-acetylhomoserine aminocarboxypropyltransferase/cysteine synthase n=2 Tax=Anaerotruncus TaxID=244127 RepID=A0A498CMV4_9FIRM|nr:MULTISPECIES: O-acetylhomoserine aminocarboxypropyltransferase/cysteine synthase family protein [Anaerotruncus]MBC3939579.1 O-acetylhomoserine aminocarboxypropyltransferase/cysteine synthase [Anaerotruncus massiliensis (ex Togo et al. 2019)]RLL08731.1 O-acetylhomoserine aminocarboxypropyltransferase/cysteine synthase [Anaerotruncus massiliensis (ex Liu et al. 2021)]
MLDYADKNYGFDTLMVHAGTRPDPETHSVALPIYQTTAYTFDSTEHAARLFELKEPGNIYTRLSNPTVDALERRVAALDGGIGALAFASGHAAMVHTFLNLAGAGDEIVSSICIYGGAINMMGVTLGRIGVKVKFVDPGDLGAWEAAVTDRTKAFFVEAIGNPNANVADIEAIAAIAHRHGVPMIVDSTFTTPYLLRPIDYGADYVVHSATKFLGGHGTAMCGIVTDAGTFDFNGNPRFPLYTEPDVSYHGVVFAKDCGNAGFLSRLRAMMLRDLGGCCAPLSAFLIMQGIETLSLRMRHISESALAIAEHLESHPDVAFVNYPGLKSSPYYPLVRKYLPKGAGGVFTFGLKGGRERGAKLIDSLELILHVTNVGDSRTLISHPASTTHSQLSDEQLAESGITPETVRLSVGLEDPADLIADLDRAIAAAK